MGLFDFLGKERECPVCGRPNAWESRGKVKCWNINCPNYDAEYSKKHAPVEEGATTYAKGGTGRTGKFDPGENRVEVLYRNAKGEDRSYDGDVRSLREKGAHITMRMVPTGQRVAFETKRVKNLEDLKSHPASGFGDPKPTAAESRVLRFHMRKGSTSALYESLRQKYPNYD